MIHKLRTVLVLLVLAPALFSVTASAQQGDTQSMQVQPAAEMSAGFEAAMKLYRRRHFSEAVDALNAVLQSEPQNAAAYYFLGYAQYVLRHFAEAQSAFEMAFRNDPAFDPRPYF